jgi:hypothetical protein
MAKINAEWQTLLILAEWYDVKYSWVPTPTCKNVTPLFQPNLIMKMFPGVQYVLN